MKKLASRLMDPFELRVLKRRWVVMAMLAPCFAVALVAAHWLRFETIGAEDLRRVVRILPGVIAIKLTVFMWFGIFRGWNSFVTFHDLVQLLKATTVSSILVAMCDYLLTPSADLPRSIFFLDWSMTTALVGGLRSLTRIRGEWLSRARKEKSRAPVLILGTNENGEGLLRYLRTSASGRYRVVGFVTTRASEVGFHIGGVPVLGKLDNIEELIETTQPSEILVASGSVSARDLRWLVQSASHKSTEVKVLPSYDQLLRGDLDLQPRPVCIEDLLRRPPVKLDQAGLAKWLTGRTLMITGAAGSIGSEITRQLLQFKPSKVVVVDRWENGLFHLDRSLRELGDDCPIELCVADVGDGQRMGELIGTHRPEIIFHAAAYKHVPLMEGNPGEAVKNIVLMTAQLADLALEHGVSSFVMISTDKAVNPTNVMGACKRVAELYVQSLQAEMGCDFITVRFGNVLDSAGSVVPIFREQIARGGPVTVTDPEMVRYFMTIPEASRLVIQAGAIGEGGEIFVLDMGNPVRIVDLAEDMIRLSGLEVGRDIEVQFVGRRPGEKLYEELYSDGERHKSTEHPKILVADCERMSRLEIARAIRQLRNLSNAPGQMVLEQLAAIVPGFDHAPLPAKKAA
ncbi:MAG: nucleoside-diphosphate sugar epimerase/dehydratase [Planctomycetota bacterium]